ncbi:MULTISPECIES: acyl carrier protein [Desulfococcus]|jgi:acyl carrier protein|uniref:Acyl carrier protein familyprotein n=1 Tax=Desulfococcus multivorans DSM 2059 TaxID=1121405 RepID=S7V440_DESML|nr:phosphopantetheine-binding protein [Desulfococcus multivorans]AQV00477.1 acyl carrier protein [Desulfococcus multivorans]EPR41309.1 acyl carrier protein familyprotein [Desulfococcus multivorans DSM 2059]MDX9818341.1 phosphopantetheine-binding protein [Desulfococcus multivorans]SJZ73234.1 acyl carrier protein [Desulfococcus multivorans DSM 2059]
MEIDDKVYERIMEILKPLVPEGVTAGMETDLTVDLGFDSLKVMKLLEDLEDGFDISIPISILPEVRTVQDLMHQIQKLSQPGT